LLEKNYSSVVTETMNKQEKENEIFRAFLQACPEFAGEGLKEWSQPADPTDFPDVLCVTASGKKVGVELGEWLDEKQMSAAKGLQRVERSILDAVGEQGENPTKNIYRVTLKVKGKRVVRVEDREEFKKNLWELILEVDRLWESQDSWHTQRGYEAKAEDLVNRGLLNQHVEWIRFRPVPPGGPYQTVGLRWIRFPPRGGSFSEDTMVDALHSVIREKQNHYGRAATGFDHLYLLVYYNEALLYNTPAEGLFVTFEDVAEKVTVEQARPFDEIFLFIAVNGGEVFRISRAN
jgi:hypothetical protein